MCCWPLINVFTFTINIPDDDFWIQSGKIEGQETSDSTTSSGYKDNLTWHVLKEEIKIICLSDLFEELNIISMTVLDKQRQTNHSSKENNLFAEENWTECDEFHTKAWHNFWIILKCACGFRWYFRPPTNIKCLLNSKVCADWVAIDSIR